MPRDKPILNPADTESVIRRYQQRIAQYGPGQLSLNSGSEEKQSIRHRVHASILQGERPHVLDLGCGLGSFYEHLSSQYPTCKYTGYDIVPDYIDFCRTRFPNCHFELRNVFTEGIGGTFDTIVMSQTFNNRYQQSDNLEVMRAAVRAAFASASVSVSVDMLSSHVDFQVPELFYYSPEEMFKFAKSLTRRVVLRHDYRPFEFCLQLFHDGAHGYDGFVA
jgi:SAM-dependent methyltransferase